ncbi:MAG: ABC transporter ATP-binding protein [Clostridia bacterium]|nr:ABC transporter ATP-binding protein [Clostridia bacterium]
MGPPGRRGPGPMMYKEKPKNMWGTLKRLVKYIGKSKYLLFALLLVMILISLLGLAAPALQGKAIDAITDGKYEHVFTLLAILAGSYLLSSALTYFQGIYAAKLAQKTVYTLRNDLFSKIAYLPIRFTDTHKHGDIMSRMTNDVENVSNTVSTSIASLFSAVITLVGTLAVMLYYSWQLTLVALVSVPLTICCTAIMSKIMRKYFIRQQRILGSLNSHVEEMVSGYKTVVAYGREGKSKEQFADINRQYKKTAIMANFFGGTMGPMMNMIGNIGYLLVAVVGGYLAFNSIETGVTIGVVQAFILYTKQFTRPINEIGSQYSMIINAIAGAERVFEIMDTTPENAEDTHDIDVESVKGNVSFRDVHFAYKKDEPVLKGFDLEVKAGEKIAIVGKTGSGKTTIVNLLTRFYDIDSGEILLDGENINNISKSSLRRSIGIVLQDTVLFSDTVEANVKYGRRDATREQLEYALEFAEADVFVERLPEGKDTKLTESGSNLSVGQRQLLSIARAVLLDPKILILDEATSSVDTRTEMQIQSAMQKLMEGRTSLIIAHRLSTIRDADKIIVLADGEVAECGNHDELLKLKGEYYNLYMTQFSGLKT